MLPTWNSLEDRGQTCSGNSQHATRSEWVKKRTQDDVGECPTRNRSASPRQRRHLPKLSPTSASLKCFSDTGSERHGVSFRYESRSPPVFDGRDGSRSCGRCWIFLWRSRESDLKRNDTTVPR